MEKLRCHYCASDAPDLGISIADGPSRKLPVGRCSNCDLVQILEFPEVVEERYSADDYMGSQLAEWRTKERHWNEKRAARLREFFGADASSIKVLDYGCGAGGFLEAAQGQFARLVGFDMNARIASTHREMGWSCVNHLDDAGYDFDVVTLFHVLEHLRSPWDTLKEIKAKYPKLQYLVTEVPNNDEALLSVFESEAYRRNHYSIEHLYYYTNRTLGRILESAGFEIVVNSQLQRYTLGNTLGWLRSEKGGGQNRFTAFNDVALNEAYERVLVGDFVADSVFLIARPKN